MSRRVWKAMEASSGEIWLGEVKEGGGQRGRRKETKRVGEETEVEEGSGGKKSSRGVGNLG